MHFCNVLIVVISCSIDLLMMLMTYFKYAELMKGNAMFAICCWYIIIYDIIAIYVSYRAYKVFKEEFAHVQGDFMSMMGGGQNQGSGG